VVCLPDQLRYLGANIKLFPTTGLLGVAAVSFHGAIASILLLYFLFWLKVSVPSPTLVTGHLWFSVGSLKVIRTIHKLSNWDKSQFLLMYRFGSLLLQCRTCWPVCTVIGLHDQCCSISYADWRLSAVGLVHYAESTWISGAPHTTSWAFYSVLLGWFVNKAKDILVASSSGVCSTASCPSDSTKWLHVGCTGMKESVRSQVLVCSHVYGFSPWVAVCVYWHTAFL
jgi:hypothetical protein